MPRAALKGKRLASAVTAHRLTVRVGRDQAPAECFAFRLVSRIGELFGSIETPHQDAGLRLNDHAGCARERLAGQRPLGALRPDAPATGHVVALVAERNDELYRRLDPESGGALHAFWQFWCSALSHGKLRCDSAATGSMMGS